ncbi:iron ABC transporter permease [Thioclava sp. GXIMD4215]|uniref:FecCD family ABC transporter permease n=1 Tax=Thioclava sp. GXIMD4215 TaxID=3131928 RepID=UPI00311AFE9E
MAAPRPAGDRHLRARLLGLGLCATLIGVMALSLHLGAAGASDVLGVLAAKAGLGVADPRDSLIIWNIRLPRTVTAALVGAALAVSGTVMQGLFRNPLADPGLVGVSAGAGLGAVAAIVLGGLLPVALLGPASAGLTPVAAFLGGWLSTFVLYRIATQGGRTSVATLLLAGIALGALTGALTGVLVYRASDSQLRDLTFWNMGSVAGASWAKLVVAAPVILAGLCLAPALARGLDAVSLGEAVAVHLGVDPQRLKRRAIVLVAATVGASVALTGGIGFVGIVVPHLLRLVQGPAHRFLLPNAALLGAITLLLADCLSRVVIAPAELPIGIVTAALGGPFFLWILLRNRALVDV